MTVLPPDERRPGSVRPPQELLGLLELEASGEDRFVATSPTEGWGRLYGGQVAAQALRAATLTVDAERLPHSLHAYFIRPGRLGTPLDLVVERTRDGRSFSTRSVSASQEGVLIFSMMVSFHRREEGEEWQEQISLADVPGPDDVPTDGHTILPRWNFGFDIRPLAADVPRPHPCWVRLRGPIPDDPNLHACALAYISDRAVVGSARPPSATFQISGTSLDHAIWFHRSPRVDQWLLFSVDPVVNSGARGLARGSFRDTDGVLVASISQEALLRPIS